MTEEQFMKIMFFLSISLISIFVVLAICGFFLAIRKSQRDENIFLFEKFYQFVQDDKNATMTFDYHVGKVEIHIDKKNGFIVSSCITRK